MKLLALAVLVLLAPEAAVRFETGGVRVGDALVTGGVLEVKGAGSSILLASGTSVEALSSSLEIGLDGDRVLALEPGLRVARVDEGYRFTAHRPVAIRFTASDETITVRGPVRVVPTAEGWQVGERTLSGRTLQAGMGAQDDAEANLEKMMKSKEKMQAGGVPRLSTRASRLYRGNPLHSGNAAESVALRQIGRVTPDGAP